MNNNEKVFHEVKSHLSEFLEEHGLKPKGKKALKCFHPDHHDTAPSMHIYASDTGEERYYCFGCNIIGDIYTANHLISGAPLFGREFLEENVAKLAKKYNMEYELRALSPEDIEIMNMRNIFSFIRSYVCQKIKNATIDSKVAEYIAEKKLSIKKDIDDFQIGYVPSWEDFFREINNMFGVSKQYLDALGITGELFNERNLIYTISDEHGKPVGFAARNCHFDSSIPSSKKYINTKLSKLYNKKGTLYNLNRAIKKPRIDGLYIVEGYSDAIALDKAEFRVGAIGGTAFVNDHIALLQRVGITDIIFLLDGDDAGKKSTARAITEVMEGVRNYRVRIASLPDGEDPDSFLYKHGVEGLTALPHVSAFEWRLRLMRVSTDLEPHEIASKMVQLIVNEESHIERDRMCHQVADVCGLDVAVIRKEVAAISSNEQIKLNNERDAAVDNIVKMLRNDPESAQTILSNGYKTVTEIYTKKSRNLYDETEYIHGLQSVFQMQSDPSNSRIFKIARMPMLEKALNGDCAGKLLLLGGQPKQTLGLNNASYYANSFKCWKLLYGQSAGKTKYHSNNGYLVNLND